MLSPLNEVLKARFYLFGVPQIIFYSIWNTAQTEMGLGSVGEGGTVGTYLVETGASLSI